MNNTDFSTTILVDQSPQEVFNAINNPRAWWSEEIAGSTSLPGDEFDYHFEDIHRCRIRVLELLPGRKVVWLVLDNHFKPGIFGQASPTAAGGGPVHQKAEWVDTTVVFEITTVQGKTQLGFTHFGLVPEYECFDACVNGWTHYVRDSLYSLITSGQGKPNKAGRPMTPDEKKFHEASHT